MPQAKEQAIRVAKALVVYEDQQQGTANSLSFTQPDGTVVAQLVALAAGVGQPATADDLIAPVLLNEEVTGSLVTMRIGVDPERQPVRAPAVAVAPPQPKPQGQAQSQEKPAPVQLWVKATAESEAAAPREDAGRSKGAAAPKDTAQREGLAKSDDAAIHTFWSLSVRARAELGVLIRRGGFVGQQTALIRLQLSDVRQLHCAYLFSDWWTRPAFPTRPADVPARTQFLLWERTDGRYGCLVPLVNGDLRATLQGAAATPSSSGPAAATAATAATPVTPATTATPSTGQETASTLDIRIDTEKSGLNAFSGTVCVMGIGPNPYQLTHATFAQALRLAGGTARGREEKAYPDCFDYLGWCSWDCFYQQVNAEGLLQKAKELRDQKVPVRWILIDDGWSPTKDRLLTGLDAERSKFPQGLAPVVRRLKQEFGMKWVGVWHAFTGYWGGVDPTAPEMQPLAANWVRSAAGQTVPGFTPQQAFGFYNSWHRHLQSEGVDLVKVDNQGALYYYARETEVLPRASEAWQHGLQASAGLNFAGRLLNCMAMSMDQAWFWKSSNVARSSDDFYPTRAGSAREHALQNIYNALWISEIAWPDWDMWWTVHPQARYHQALRAISGGPVYTSDPLGQTDAALLEPLVFRDGRVLRCDRPPLPTRDTLFREPQVLKAFNSVGQAGILGLFWAGVSEAKQLTQTALSDIEGLTGSTYAVHEYYTGQHCLLTSADQLTVELAPWEARVYSLVPVTADPVAFAAIGLVDKIIAPRSVLDVELHPAAAKRSAWARVTLYEGGRLLAYCRQHPTQVTLAKAEGASAEAVPTCDQTLPWQWEDGWLEVNVPTQLNRPIIEIVW